MPRTRTFWLSCLVAALSCLFIASAAPAGVIFKVGFVPQVRAEPATGRLVVYLIRTGSGANSGASPADGPFFESPQPMFGIDVKGLAPGAEAVVDDSATAFPVKLSELPAGDYKAQAVLDMHQDDSSWRREPGNLYSDTVSFKVAPGTGNAAVSIALNRVVSAADERAPAGVELFRMRSELLSKFRGRDVMLRAGVVAPRDLDPARSYAAVYEVPGFGSNHLSAGGTAAAYASAPKASPFGTLARNTYWIALDPEGPNGHHLFADSANNGPVGEALIKELLPALEAKYHLIASPSARLLRGHSSGGWSTLWLCLRYPEVFGATWSTSPDPLDFRKFQLGDIYSEANMYVARPPAHPAPGVETPSAAPEVSSYREGGASKMTVRQENRMEEVLGPRNTSGQQWDSWQAVFGPVGDDGHPAELYEHRTGLIDRAVAEKYRAYDIGSLLRADPARYCPILLQRAHILVGDQDSYYLNEAVALFKADVERLCGAGAGPHDGSIKVLHNYDHGSIFGSPEMRAIPEEMTAFLRRGGHILADKKTPAK